MNRCLSVDANGNRSTTFYDSAGRASASINQLGNRWTTVFNSVGQTVGSKDPLGNRSTGYDTAGHVHREGRFRSYSIWLVQLLSLLPSRPGTPF